MTPENLLPAGVVEEFAAAESVVSRLRFVTALPDAERWCADAHQCLQRLTKAAANVEAQQVVLTEQLPQERLKAKTNSIWGWLFKSDQEKAIRDTLGDLTRLTTKRRSLALGLQQGLESTPSSASALTRMIADMKAAKKSLELKKKQLALEMRDVRIDARQRSAKVGASLTGLALGGKYRAAARTDIRTSKERALAPRESAKAEIERELLSIEQRLNQLTALK